MILFIRTYQVLNAKYVIEYHNNYVFTKNSQGWAVYFETHVF